MVARLFYTYRMENAMKRQIVLVFAVLFSISLACSSTPTSTTVSTQGVSQVINTTIPPIATTTPSDTPLPTQTNTPLPTITPEPTNTPRPTSTPTPIPTPVTLSGNGNDVIDNPWQDLGLLHITYQGGGNFAIWSFDADGNKIDLLVNTIGNYEGTVPLNFRDSEPKVARFQVESDGPWTIEIRPLNMIRVETVPGTFTGNSDDVVYLKGSKPDVMTATASGGSYNFAIWTVTSDGNIDLAVNEISPYSGKTVLSKDTNLLIINAEGDWTIDITGR
jgi:hypothetical protein